MVIRRRLCFVLTLSIVLLLSFASIAAAGTITTRLKPHKVYYAGQYWNHIAPTQMYVYGPNGYYRTAYCRGAVLPAGLPFVCGDAQSTFTGAPLGSYRVRFVSNSIQGCRGSDWSWYFTTWFLGPDYTVNYTSP